MSNYLTALKPRFGTSRRVHDVEEQIIIELPIPAASRISTSANLSSLLLESSSELNPSSNVTGGNQRFSTTNKSINIQVGSKDAARSFRVSTHLLCTFSEYFKDRCRSKARSHIDLPEESPVAFEMFVSWLTQQEKPVTYTPNQYSEEPWRSESANAWMLGRKLHATQFQKYALSQFIQNCALSNLSTWELIEKDVPLKTPLRRFSEYWITWNFHLAAPGQSEFCILKTARKSVSVTDSTRDPRIYDLVHWYSVCGDEFIPKCAHDPIARDAALEKANRVKIPLPEWGSDWERRVGGGSNGNSNRSFQPTTNLNTAAIFTQPTRQSRRSCPSFGKIMLFLVTAFLGICFASLVIAATILCSRLLGYITSGIVFVGIRYTTITYSIFTCAVGVITTLCPPIFVGYGFFGFADGIALALDTKSCGQYNFDQYGNKFGDQYYGTSCPYQEMVALTAIVWTSLVMVTFYGVAFFMSID